MDVFPVFFGLTPDFIYTTNGVTSQWFIETHTKKENIESDYESHYGGDIPLCSPIQLFRVFFISYILLTFFKTSWSEKIFYNVRCNRNKNERRQKRIGTQSEIFNPKIKSHRWKKQLKKTLAVKYSRKTKEKKAVALSIEQLQSGMKDIEDAHSVKTPNVPSGNCSIPLWDLIERKQGKKMLKLLTMNHSQSKSIDKLLTLSLFEVFSIQLKPTSIHSTLYRSVLYLSLTWFYDRKKNNLE